MNGPGTDSRARTLVLALLPLLLMAALVAIFLRNDPTAPFKAAFPPVEELSVQRAILEEGSITLQVVNDGPDPVTIAQVLVDDAYWSHHVEPDRTIAPHRSATVTIPYAWVQDETHVVVLITSSGVTFEHEITVAVASPRPTARLLGLFALLGIYVGVIPVMLGLLWLPALRRTSTRVVDFFVFLTIGLLVYLAFDGLEEALELLGDVPGAYQGTGLLVIGGVGGFALLSAVSKAFSSPGADAGRRSLAIAAMVAIGIGLHNLGEGLAIGAAYAVGEVSLGTMLVVGFALHNTTEGLAIVAPLTRTRVRLRQLVVLGAIGGLPTIAGTWIGGFVYTPGWALLFLAVGIGAIAQVVWQILVQVATRRAGWSTLLDLPDTAGLIAGFLVMYLTGFFVLA